MMKLAERSEGRMMLKAIEYRAKVTEYVLRNEVKDYGFYTKEEFARRYNFYIGRFHGLLEALTEDLKTTEGAVIQVMNNIERRGK